MRTVINWLRIALPFLQMGETILETLDSNTTGTDDEAANFLKQIVIPGLSAIVAGQPLPDSVKEGMKSF